MVRPSNARTVNEPSQISVVEDIQSIFCTSASTMNKPNIAEMVKVATVNPLAIISADVENLPTVNIMMLPVKNIALYSWL